MREIYSEYSRVCRVFLFFAAIHILGDAEVALLLELAAKGLGVMPADPVEGVDMDRDIGVTEEPEEAIIIVLDESDPTEPDPLATVLD